MLNFVIALNLLSIPYHSTPCSPLTANGKRADAVGLLLAKGANVDQKHAQGM